MRIAVIGKGLIGSAAARHLAEAGHEVALIGPDEPTEKAGHDGVFGSHYDEGRITRSLDPWPFWSRVSRASIARYAEIEAKSGVRFFTDAGIMMAGPKGSRPIRAVEEIATRDGIACEAYEGAALAARFPFFAFPEGTRALFEPTRAGFISPRALVHAQGIAAEKAGAEILRAEALGIDEGPGGVVVGTSAGEVAADRVLVAAGGFSNMVLPQPLDLKVFARTVVLLEISEAEAERLQGMPPLIYLMPSGEDPYLLPPIRYPDGKNYLKMGGDRVDVALPDAEATKAWFRSGGDTQVGAMLEGLVRDRMPGLEVMSAHTAACVTSYTPDNIAALRMVSDRVGVAVGGCGRGAKCSDELGRLGAEVIQGHALPDWAFEAAV